MCSNDALKASAPIKIIAAHIEHGIKALNVWQLQYARLGEDDVKQCELSVRCLTEGPFKKTFLAQLMGIKITERLAELTRFFRTQEAVNSELESLRPALTWCCFDNRKKF